jgi:hypothetical protein
VNWFWMNVPLEVVFFAAWVGIPLWFIARHRHWGPDPASPWGNPELEAVLVTVRAGEEPAGERDLVAAL